MTISSERACSEAIAAGAGKRISRNWGVDLVDGGLHEMQPLFSYQGLYIEQNLRGLEFEKYNSINYLNNKE
jgi:hypothetical protein